MFSNKSPAVRQASIIARSSVESVSLASVSARCQRYGARSPMSRDAETDAVEAVKQLSLLESALLRHRTLTIVGTGWVGSAATHIYLAAEREHRYALPNTRFLIHQPAGGGRRRRYRRPDPSERDHQDPRTDQSNHRR